MWPTSLSDCMYRDPLTTTFAYIPRPWRPNFRSLDLHSLPPRANRTLFCGAFCQPF
ncbi:uncharacterized protein B0I36DRAFT_311864 [Microdochium trichocladiopsis]|uniref:Uncharacterized protein n=1 Tax=Microdochium trichocladiopsis TaxID=1682393 RepID=A0A9P8YL32_9PEZI|nr:uncharacterized protein B0I36DRAFT_311864 [Microdochium trichocladiopsis]KAH7040975.1 hypothetical protein B0I36DRAFT_311864 [Microdochium trichocladiopsis]